VLTDARLARVSGTITYRLNKRLSFTLDAAHEEQTANQPDSEYDSDRVAVGLAVSF
jgi:hypothetical protein